MRRAPFRLKFPPSISALLMIWVLVPARGLPAAEVRIDGETMGTTYHITVVAAPGQAFSGLRREIEVCLERINASMSTYRSDSEITRFNGLKDAGRALEISADFFQVLQAAARLHQITGGAWDGTVGPLVTLWGFGSSPPRSRIPSPQEIRRALAKVGFGGIRFCGQGCIAKETPELSLDLASMAKGYGVDAVAKVIAGAGSKNYLVEIGGEIYAAGRRPDGTPWRVGINRPLPQAAPTDIYQVVTLENMALATSGDYRNFFENDGVRYSHVIDPRSGYPVATGVVSATVLAGDCTVADGLATALMVMGPAEGLRLVQSLPAVECLLVVRDASGGLTDVSSPGFENHRLAESGS